MESDGSFLSCDHSKFLMWETYSFMKNERITVDSRYLDYDYLE